jgi:erythromycin esterase-like protein
MLTGLKVFITLLFWCSLLFSAQAQTLAPLPVHVVRSINPADTDFQDLEFLRQEIGPARVVMLGEPTHGEGNVFEAKIRLLRFLQQRMGFTTLAFESGFYDLHKAQRELEAGKSAQEALGNSVFSIWTGVQEFQAVMPLVGKGKLRVAGFDPQLSGGYGGDLVDDLQAFLAPEKGAVALNYDYLDEVISFMADNFFFLPTTKLADFEKEMAKATRLTEKAATGPDNKRRAEALFWQQCLRSLLAQARDYDAHDPSQKDEKSFKAVDSNPRDAQMADNLLWYLRQHPQEKVVCWGALGHFSNKAEVLDNAELQAYRPMGRAVKAALGADQVYILGTLAGGGTYSFNTSVPAPAAGSLEADLLAQGNEYSFVSLKHEAPGRQLTTSAFDYKPLTGPWSEVVDGFLFLRSVNPPHQVKLVVGTITVAAPVAPTAPSAMNPAPRRASGTVQAGGQVGATVRGVVLDQKTKTPVPYASVAVTGQTVGTVADGQGRFSLTMPRPGTLQVSSVGYTTTTVPGKAGELLTVLLAPSAYELQDVQVRGESLDPRKIMKKVLAALPANYEQQDYAAEVYSRRRVINFDTLRHETEYVSQIFEPAGHRNWAGGFLMMGPGQTHRVQEVHVIKKPGQEGYTGIMEGGPGFFASAADPVRISPLFKSSTLKKFRLRLDSVVERGTETLYIIGFEAKHANHRSTGTYLQSGYSGRLYVQKSDYAVLRYEALWEGDTATRNAVARRVYGKQNMTSRLYTSLYADARTDHVVTYARAANGHYYARHSTAQGISVGRVLGGIPFHFQKYCDQYFTVLPAGTVAPLLNPKLDPHWAGSEIYQITNIKDYHPEFWEAYKRPMAETSLPATVKP